MRLAQTLLSSAEIKHKQGRAGLEKFSRPTLTAMFIAFALLFLACALMPISNAAAAAAPAHRGTSTVSTGRPSSSASSGNFGLGLMLGEPTGLSAKYWLSRNNALQFGLTYSFDHYVALLTDFLWHFPGLFGSSSAASQFVPYVGIGGELLFDTGYYEPYDGRYYRGHWHDGFNLGMRVPLGIEFLPHKAPIGIFAELVPGIGLIPGVFGFFQGDIGIRFYL